MKDKQIAPASTEPRIFFVSAFLHCISMTALVHLRSSFGFGYLRPKSVFFAFSWAFTLYSIYAWIDRAAWREHRATILLGLGTVVLYWSHLAVAFAREWRESGEHEQHSGLPHPVWLARRLGVTPTPAFERKCRLWGEPAATLALAVAARLIFGEQGLARWLLVVAACLWSKEALNRWFELRGRKRRKDLFTDTEDAVELSPAPNLSSESPLAARKARVKRSRSADTAGVDVTSDSE